MTNYPPLYILRHGETEWNVEGRLQGHYDSPLTAQGRAQARAQNAILKQCDLADFTALSSPQKRARDTAQIALEGLLPFATDKGIAEIGLGAWAGRGRAELLAECPQARDSFDLYEEAPGGEGFAALHARCRAFLSGLTGPHVLVTHGITSRMLRLILTGRDLDQLRRMQGGQGVVFQIRDGQQRRLKL
ncbi:histidine phosphatase family protein [Sulfitobacter sp. PS-8MA]|uniref:histidine phosphatase family protein n=1 Tax=Sulfitobacter sp. PS-8MA TaxID=3237707 RepID=UPI0034C6CA9A